MAKKKYLPLYNEWLKTMQIPGGSGLCLALEKSGFDHGEIDKYIQSGDNAEWEHWMKSDDGVFDVTRQNMLLLIAAANNEL